MLQKKAECVKANGSTCWGVGQKKQGGIRVVSNF